MIIAIVDAKGSEQSRAKVTEALPQDLLEHAASVTVESHNMEFPEDEWTVKILDE